MVFPDSSSVLDKFQSATFSYRIKTFSGAISFCRRATLIQ